MAGLKRHITLAGEPELFGSVANPEPVRVVDDPQHELGGHFSEPTREQAQVIRQAGLKVPRARSVARPAVLESLEDREHTQALATGGSTNIVRTPEEQREINKRGHATATAMLAAAQGRSGQS